MKNLLSVVIFNFLSCVTTVSSFAIDSVGVSVGDFSKDGSDICRNGYCGSVSYKYLRRSFRGLFHSTDDISTFDRVNNAVLATPLTEESILTQSEARTSDDGSICCSTLVRHVNKTEMVNIEGKTMKILHIQDGADSSLQYIPHASCVRKGSCPGECVVEGKILTLLAWHFEGGMKFDFFEVPGYCSCKNIGSFRSTLQETIV